MENSRKLIPLFLGIAVALGMFIGSKLNFSDPNAKLFSTNEKKEKLNRLIDYIDYEYVDEVNTDSIVEVTVNRILENLDPHSTYISPEDLAQVTQNMKGDFIGVGISYQLFNDTIAVISTIKGGPSDIAGIKPGDRLLLADNDTLFGANLEEQNLGEKLKGELNSRVRLTVFRKGEGEKSFVVKRGRVPLESVDAAYIVSDSLDLGYIKINRFAETTYKEFKEALNTLQSKGMKTLVLDLRDNGGGFISPALKIADEFLGDDQLIMFTKNKKGKIDRNFATRTGSFEKGDLYVLINENSASASEIVAGAVQDNDRGTIVGRRSYGKGLVQREMALGDGSAVRLTISRYYTPTGRSIQRPYGNGNEAYHNDYLERYKNGELQNSDSIQVADSLKFKTPGGKIVYGGGGIIPDIFVGKSTSRMEETLNFMLRSGFMNRFIFEFLDEDRPYYNSLTQEEFENQILVENETVTAFETFAKERNIDINLSGHLDKTKRYLKATIAQQLFGNTAFERILNNHNPMLTRVENLVKDELYPPEEEMTETEVPANTEGL